MTDIKSNNPHLTGGGKSVFQQQKILPADHCYYTVLISGQWIQVWANYCDLSEGHSNWWFNKGIPALNSTKTCLQGGPLPVIDGFISYNPYWPCLIRG